MSYRSRPLLVVHHLGLGDHIICNGMVRHLQGVYRPSTLWLVTTLPYLASVQFMYRDDPAIRFVPVMNYLEVPGLPLNWYELDVVRAGYEKLRYPLWDRSFYEELGLDFDLSWERFFVGRDLEAEAMLARIVDPPRDFALVHRETSEGPMNLVADTDLPVIEVRRVAGFHLFHWIGLALAAREIHCLDSAFIHLVDRLAPIREQRLVYHQIRDERHAHFGRKRDWRVIRILYPD